MRMGALTYRGAAQLFVALLLYGFANAQSLPHPASAAAGFSAEAASLEAIYTVSDLLVDEKAETSALARDTALGVARRNAYARLLRRLVLPEDQALAPELSEDQLSDLISGIEVAGEKTSNQRYLARLTIRFAPEAVRSMLRDAGARFSETSAAPILLLPVFESGGSRILWEQLNPWRDALGAAIAEEGAGIDRLSPLYLPHGDFQDFSAISADQAVAAEPARVSAFLDRYGAHQVLIAHATPSPGTLGVSLSWRGVPPEISRVERFATQGDETTELLLARAARSLVREMQESWKRETALDFSQNATVLVLAPLISIDDWLSLRKQLAAVPMIRQIDLQMLSAGEAQLMLHYLGTPENLQSALLKHNLILLPAGAGWVLSKQLK